MKMNRLKLALSMAAIGVFSLSMCGSLSYFKMQMEDGLLGYTFDETSRVAHAKELLGKKFKGSPAQTLKGNQKLGHVVYKQVQSSLSPKWKKQARSIAQTIIVESEKYKLDPVFVVALIKTESKFNPTIVGQHGEIGLMQIKPETAQWLSKKLRIPWSGKQALKNPSINIRIGLAYMNYLREQFRGRSLRYLTAYNMGPANVRRVVTRSTTSTNYSARVMQNYTDLYAKINSSRFIASLPKQKEID